ncbi:PucR family transcriptional regulator [Patulibacter defluvii]|uniref:PucR family transcriptional regulator n=1 Tax=Patulibacter defluvii TaxID=3095358 RepID=UPI002A764F0F|nr:helix-turn-helix domain-containing protein [Patulibacter sp. DM4]
MAAVCDRVDRTAVVDAILARITVEVPALGAIPPDVLDGPLRETVARSVEQLLDALAREREYRSAEAREIGERCADLAVWGVRVEDVVGWFAVGTPVLWEALARTSYPHELEPLLAACGRLLGSAGMIYDVVVAMGAGAPEPYEEESATRSLLASPALAADPEARAAAERLGIDLDRTRIPFVVRPAGGRPREHAAIARRLRGAGAIALTRHRVVVGLAAAAPAADGIEPTTVVAVGEPIDLEQREDAWQRLAELAATAARLGRHGTLAEPDLAIERMLLGAPSIAATFARPVHRLAAAGRGDGELVAAATALLDANLNRQAAATALGLHPSTLRYRASRIEAIAGVDLTRLRDRCVLAVGLTAAALRRDGATPAPSAASQPYPAALAADIAARIDRDALARAITDAYCAGYPSFAALPDVEVALLPGVREGIDEILDVLCDDRPAGELEFRRADERVLEHLQLGVTPEDTLRAIGTAGAMVWQAVLAETTASERQVLPMVAGRMFHYASAVTRAAKEAPNDDRPVPVTASRELIDALTSPVADPRRVAAATRNLGLDPEARLRPVAALAPPAAGPGQLAASFRTAGWPAAERGREVLAVVPAELPVEQLPPALVTAVADPVRGDALTRELATARSLLRIARHHDDRGLVTVADRPFELLVDANPELALAVRNRVVGRLQDPGARRGPDLTETLRAYLEADLDRRAAASALHLHPNSLDHRLRRIGELTGLTFTSTADLLVLTAGVVADQLGHAP